MNEEGIMDEERKTVEGVADPAPLGLSALGVSTLLLSLHYLGIFSMDAMVASMAVFYGGMAQMIAGWMEWKKGDTFSTVSFTSLGLFWESFAFLILLPKINAFQTLRPSPTSMGFYFFLWGILVFCMFVCTLKHPRALQVLFFTLLTFFWLLAIREWSGSTLVGIVAGWEGVVCGLCALYLGVALFLKEIYAKPVLPI